MLLAFLLCLVAGFLTFVTENIAAFVKRIDVSAYDLKIMHEVRTKAVAVPKGSSAFFF